MSANQDTLDVARDVILARYLDALKAGEEEARKAALEELKELNQKKMARLIKEAQS